MVVHQLQLFNLFPSAFMNCLSAVAKSPYQKQQITENSEFTPCSSLHSHALQFVKGRQCMIILANVIQVYVNNFLYVVLQCTANYDYG